MYCKNPLAQPARPYLQLRRFGQQLIVECVLRTNQQGSTRHKKMRKRTLRQPERPAEAIPGQTDGKSGSG